MQLAKMLALGFVVYTYYVAPLIGEDNQVRVVVSTGFFSAIALAMLPLVSNHSDSHAAYGATQVTKLCRSLYGDGDALLRSYAMSWVPTTCFSRTCCIWTRTSM